MKKVLVVQNELPLYRDFLWKSLRSSIDLYLVCLSENKMILPDLNIVPINYNFICKVKIDVLVLDAGYRQTFSNLIIPFLVNCHNTIGWTQLLGKRKNKLILKIRVFLLNIMFKRIMFYYDHEYKICNNSKFLLKSIGLSNTVEDPPEVLSNRHQNHFLFLGRLTKKANFDLLLNAISILKIEVYIHLIGINQDEIRIPDGLNKECFKFYGNISDQKTISEIASKCWYFIYPGEVGLSIIHALKLGLIPIIHSNMNSHMPEAKAAASVAPILFFEYQNEKSLALTMSLAINSKIFISKEAQDEIKEQFAQKKMISNFLNCINGNI